MIGKDRYRDYIFIISVFIAYIFKLDFLSILIFLCYILNYIKDKSITLKYTYILFLIISNVLGVFVIEFSKAMYLYEIAQLSAKEHTLAPIILVQMICLQTIKLFDKKFEIKFEKKFKQINFIYSDKLFRIITIFLIILITIMLIRVINKPFFKLGYDRFAYQKNILNKTERLIGNVLLWASPLFYLYLNKKNKKIGILGLFIFNIYFFWIGHKFSVFFMAAQLGFIIIKNNIDYKMLNKYINKLTIIFILMIFVVIFQSTMVGKRSLYENIDYFKIRLSQQGQLWWGVYKEDLYREAHVDEAKKEIELFFSIKEDEELRYNLGMFKVMRLVAPKYIVENKIKQGSRYAYSTQANILYYFNYPILLLISIFIGIGIAYITNLLIFYVNQRNIIGILIISKMWTVYVRMMSNSDFNTLFSIENLLSVIILLFISLLPRKKVINK